MDLHNENFAIMMSLLTFLSLSVILLSSVCSAKGTQSLVAQTDRSIRVCSRLRDMFIDQGCLEQESLKCKLIAFKLRGGILTNEPRCDFLPCVGYKQPENQTCESTCFGDVIPTGLCATGKTCCVQSNKPRLCPYTCKSAYICKTPVNGYVCPYAGDVCCNPSDIFLPFPTKAPCSFTCLSPFDCKDIDYTSTCGFGLNVCCKTPGNPFPFDVSSDFGQGLQVGQQAAHSSFGNYRGLGYFDDGFGNRFPSLSGDSYGYDNKEPQSLCPYTCRSSVDCSEIYTTTGCGSGGDVCCKTVYVPPTTTQEPTCPYECRGPLLCEEEDVNFACSGRKVCCKRRKRDAVAADEITP